MEELVWVVSFAIDEDGQYADYAIDIYDLYTLSEKAAMHLREQMGKGVFLNAEEAEDWARLQVQPRNCGGCKQGREDSESGKGCCCPRSH
jgi:hypothetical protein